MSKPYHKYVFDQDKREFVGKFDEMYRQEEVEHFDSWEQENTEQLTRKLCLAVIGRHKFESILDFGCGKGFFTGLLKDYGKAVNGVDVSETAISKATASFPGIAFSVCNDDQFIREYKQKHDLILTLEVLSYIKNWKAFIKAISEKTNWYLLTLYLPENPIGFVKSFDELKAEVQLYFNIETELLVNREQLLLFAKVKDKK